MSPRVYMLMPLLAVSQIDAASGQEFPVKPIRIITSESGGSGDFVSRLLVQLISPSLGQQIIVDNRPSVIIAGETVAKAPPDGHTLIAYGGTLWLGPFLRASPYDPVRDFAPVVMASSSPCVLVVHPALPVRSVKDLIALAKAKPGVLNYGSGNSGAITHLAPELFKTMTRTSIVRIPYKGAGPALNDLMGGQVQMMIATSPSAAPHIKSGRLRALGVTSSGRSALFPGLVTVAAAGVPGYEAVAYTGIFATAHSPAAAINRLNREIVAALARPDVKQKFLDIFVEAVGGTPEQLAATVKSEMTTMGKVIKDAGIREE